VINLDAHEVTFTCPRCRFHNSARLKQVRLRDVVICRGCRGNIQLDDFMNSYRRARLSIEHALDDLRRAFGG